MCGHLANFKVSRDVVVGELPKTSTGKVQKNFRCHTET